MAKIKFELELENDETFVYIFEHIKPLLSYATEYVDDYPMLVGFIARVIMPDNIKPTYAFGIVDDPRREAKILGTIFPEATVSLLYTDLAPDFADALMFKFKHCYNEELGLYELSDVDEKQLLSLMAKAKDNEDSEQ